MGCPAPTSPRSPALEMSTRAVPGLSWDGSPWKDGQWVWDGCVGGGALLAPALNRHDDGRHQDPFHGGAGRGSVRSPVVCTRGAWSRAQDPGRYGSRRQRQLARPPVGAGLGGPWMGAACYFPETDRVKPAKVSVRLSL